MVAVRLDAGISKEWSVTKGLFQRAEGFYARSGQETRLGVPNAVDFAPPEVLRAGRAHLQRFPRSFL